MYAQHIEGSVIGCSYEESYIDVKTVYFGSGNKDKASKEVAKEYKDMIDRGFINVCIVTEHSDGKYANPQMLDRASKLAPFIEDMTCQQIEDHWKFNS